MLYHCDYITQSYIVTYNLFIALDTWDPVSTEALWDLVSEKTLKISVQQTASQVYGVTLEIDGVNISDKLVEMGLAVRKSGKSEVLWKHYSNVNNVFIYCNLL